MQCAVIDLCCVRVAVVRVARDRLIEPFATRALNELQPRFGVLPILLVSFSAPSLMDVRGFSYFPTAPYVEELVEWNSFEAVEWVSVPDLVEQKLPF